MLSFEEATAESILDSFYIPIKPKVLSQLHWLMDDEDAAILDFAKIISKDVSLSASILSIVNSSLFSIDKNISDIQHAVCFIGKDGIISIASSVLFERAFCEIKSCLSLERFWDDSKDIAFAMTFINKKIQSPLSDGCLYSIGLFHDCGIPAFANKFDDYKELLIEANQNMGNSVQLENSKYGFNHLVVGHLIARSWHLSETICKVILHHHDLNFISNCQDINTKTGYAMLKLAENLVHRNKRYCESPDWKFTCDEVLNTLDLDVDEYIELEKYYSSLIL